MLRENRRQSRSIRTCCWLTPPSGLNGYIHSNWTFGCMALRDSDMDELFSHSEIAAGTPLWIYGGELSRADLVSDSLAPSYDPHKIGIRQRELGLPTSCLMDVETRKKIH